MPFSVYCSYRDFAVLPRVPSQGAENHPEDKVMAFHVDDYQIRWKNFRGFDDSGWITLRPLTVLIGANNSGKTSTFAPLLLMAQTVLSPDGVTPLVTRGPIVDGGTFRDISHNRDTENPIYFGFKFHLHKPTKRVKAVGAYPPGMLEVILSAGEQLEDIQLDQFDLSDVYERPLFTRARNADGTYTFGSTRFKNMTQAEEALLKKGPPTNFMFTPGATLEAARSERNEQPVSKFSESFSRYLSCISFAYGDVSSILRNLVYIGPLRDHPKRYYEIAGSEPRSVGTHGEDMANVVRRKYQKIKRQLNAWVARFEFGEHLRVESPSDDIFSLSFETNKPEKLRMNIADSGFGVSQVLPLIVQALTARPYSLTIAEQPEIHLNPRLQCTLADLFVEMANSDHRVIVETHSEHLLLRLRRLIATKKIKHSSVAVYFVEKDSGVSKVTRVPLDENGGISTSVWPKGFFEETLRESLALAADQSAALRKSRNEKRAQTGTLH